MCNGSVLIVYEHYVSKDLHQAPSLQERLCMNPAPTKCVMFAAAAVSAEETVEELLVFACSVLALTEQERDPLTASQF